MCLVPPSANQTRLVSVSLCQAREGGGRFTQLGTKGRPSPEAWKQRAWSGEWRQQTGGGARDSPAPDGDVTEQAVLVAWQWPWGPWDRIVQMGPQEDS